MKIIVHTADEGGYWAEAPNIPGCASQGDTWPEFLRIISEAIAGYSFDRPTTDDQRPTTS